MSFFNKITFLENIFIFYWCFSEVIKTWVLHSSELEEHSLSNEMNDFFKKVSRDHVVTGAAAPGVFEKLPSSEGSVTKLVGYGFMQLSNSRLRIGSVGNIITKTWSRLPQIVGYCIDYWLIVGYYSQF